MFLMVGLDRVPKSEREMATFIAGNLLELDSQ